MSISIEEALDDLETEYFLTSGQRSWTTRLENISETYNQMLTKLSLDIESVTFEMFTNIKNTIIQVVRDRLPMDTGRLRAEFEKSVSVNVFRYAPKSKEIPKIGGGSFQLGETDLVAEMTIDISRLISAVPYAIYHIEELILKDTYSNPSVKGTQPLDLTILADGIRNRLNIEFYTMMTAKGWDLEWENIKHTQEATFDQISQYISTVGVKRG